MPMTYASPTAAALAGRLNDLRRQRPVVHNIINPVAAEVAAMAMLAVGASPVMAEGPEEVVAVARASAAFTINLGTPTESNTYAMHLLAEAAPGLGRPWVLDPVGVGLTETRQRLAELLVRRRPTAIRGNVDEIAFLAATHAGTGSAPAARGVDAGGETADIIAPAARLARATGSVVAVTGAVDRVTDGERVFSIANGDPMMTRVTGMGCALSCIVGAFLAVGPDDPAAATAAALATVAVAGEQAAADAAGPGSLRSAVIDRLYDLDPDRLADSLRLEVATVASAVEA